MKEISILYLLKLITKNLFVILLTTVVLAAATFCYCHFLVVPQYSATASIIVSNGTIITDTESGTGKDLSSDISASVALAKNCTQLLQTPEMYKKVASQNNISNHNSIRKAFKIVQRSEDMMILDITSTAGSPKDAVTLVNSFASTSPDYISGILTNARINVVAEAEGAVQVAPQTIPSTLIGAVIGFILAVLVFLIIDMFDQSIHTEEDLSENFATLPILGVIPDFLTAPTGGYTDGSK